MDKNLVWINGVAMKGAFCYNFPSSSNVELANQAREFGTICNKSSGVLEALEDEKYSWDGNVPQQEPQDLAIFNWMVKSWGLLFISTKYESKLKVRNIIKIFSTFRNFSI